MAKERTGQYGGLDVHVSQPGEAQGGNNDLGNPFEGTPFDPFANPISDATSSDSDKRKNGLGTLGTGGLLPGASWATFGQSAGQAPPGAPPSPPTLGQTNMIGLQSELSHEQRGWAASTILTGGGGLTDEPTTASQVLLGS